MKKPGRKSFSAEEFVENLLSKGERVLCDETLESFDKTDVPPYYDENLYKRGQAFFYDNMYGLILSHFIGLITVIALPDGLKILRMTKRGSTSVAAYRRYLATVYHVMAWYDFDFRPGSRLLASISDVKRKHNAASKQGKKQLNFGINQKDMALTQFGFMGFALIRSEMFGMHNPKKEDLKGFVHVWRVLGYVLGIQDRFNICRESIQETKDICSILVKRVFTPLFENPAQDFMEMAKNIIEGMSVVDPLADYGYCMTSLQMLLENTNDYNSIKHENYKTIPWAVKIKISVMSAIMYSFRYKIFRMIGMYHSMIKLWFMRVFPLFAYIKYGFKNGYVDFLEIINVKTKKN